MLDVIRWKTKSKSPSSRSPFLFSSQICRCARKCWLFYCENKCIRWDIAKNNYYNIWTCPTKNEYKPKSARRATVSLMNYVPLSTWPHPNARQCNQGCRSPVVHRATSPSLWPSGIDSRLGRNRLWVRFLTVSDIYPMFIEPTITWVPSGFSGYIWLDTKIVLKKRMSLKSSHDANVANMF